MKSAHFAASLSLLICSSQGVLIACSGSPEGGSNTGPFAGAGAGGSLATAGGSGIGTSGSPAVAGFPSTAGTGGGGVPGVAGSNGVAGASTGGTSAGGEGGESMGGQPMGGSAGSGPGDLEGCLPEFREVCFPPINFENEDPGNSENFDQAIPDPVATLQEMACRSCSLLYRSADEVPRVHDELNLVIDDHDGVAYAGGNSIHISTRHIQNYDNLESARVEFRGVLLHEVTHLYQENGGSSDGALIEGIADFVRVRAGLYGPGRCGGGDSWDGPYTISGCFFSWLAGPAEYHEQGHPEADPDIGYRINALMSDGKNAIRDEIEETFGTDVNSLWNQYKDDF